MAQGGWLVGARQLPPQSFFVLVDLGKVDVPDIDVTL